MLAEQQPDLIILDIIMPGLDGLAVCRRIRADTRYNNIAILFLTARGQTDDVVVGLDAGGDDYVIKPFELAELDRPRARTGPARPAQRHYGKPGARDR